MILMKFVPFAMDIESIINKINRKQIIMDSEFQRGEVWPPAKKKKLIDTLIRQWPIPPVIFLKSENGGNYEILDGLQRITTIYQFIEENKVSIDGRTKPLDNKIFSLNGLTFHDLKRRSDENAIRDIVNIIYSTAITIYEITDANSEEIAELFNRFNSPMGLSTVEKRNAHFGQTRTQIKTLLERFESYGASLETLGFSNHRGTYEDIILKVCYTLQYETVDKKISADMLLAVYRDEQVFDNNIIELVESTFAVFFNANKYKYNKYSRATIYSILIFIATVNPSHERLKEILGFVAQNNDSPSSLKSLYDEHTMYASTDYKSIRVRQAILKLLSDESKDFNSIVSEHTQKDESQVLSFAMEYNYIRDN